MDWTALLGYLKLPTRVVATVAISALVFLILPEQWLAFLNLANVRTDYGAVVGFALVIAVAFLVVDIIARAFKAAVKWRSHTEFERKRKARREENEARQKEKDAAEQAKQAAERAEVEKQRISYVNELTERERAELRKFIGNNARTCWLNAEDGVVSELVCRGVIYQSNQHAHVDLNFQAWGAYFTINDWAWDHFRERPELIAEQSRSSTTRRRS
jgi:hypothetical protein